MLNKFIEEIIDKFDKLCPEFGKWRMDRNLARTYLKTSLNEVVDAREKEILKEIEFEAYEEGKTEGEMMISLKDIKKIINKKNK